MHRFRIGLLAVMVLIGLRLSLGCHFLYEGIWKIRHSDTFNAEPFLTQAKGPVAWLFYAMVPDIDGRERLRIETSADGKKTVNTSALAARWDGICRDFLAYYPPPSADEANAAEAARKSFVQRAEETRDNFKKWMAEYFAENVDDIATYFSALDRFEGKTSDPHSEIGQDAPFQEKRHWDRMMELRREADVWIKNIEAQERAYKNSLYALLDDTQEAKGLVPRNPNPLLWDRMDQINFAVTYGLTAIGACLMLGLCTRLAALGGAAFMAFVVMTQPAFPTVYPPDPEIVGHALLINKDFVEMMALLVIVTVPAGRWGGLDFFLRRMFRRMFGLKSVKDG